MKRYVRASGHPFSTTEDISQAVRQVFGKYIAKEEYIPEVKQYWFSLEKVWGNFSIIAGREDKSSRVPGALYTGSNADGWSCFLKITDKEATAPILDTFREMGFQEACNYRNSQWGTYKIAIRSYSELKMVFKVFKNFVQGKK